MFLDDFVQVRINKQNLEWYLSKGYDVSPRFITVKTTDIYPTSVVKVRCKCDYCGKEVRRAYNRACKAKHTCGGQECKKKLRAETNLKLYGSENTFNAHDLQVKAAKSKFLNQSAHVSPQQKYIANVVNGVMNYNIDKYLIDVALIYEKIAIEFDGIGHDMQVQLKRLTQEEFEQKELERESVIFSFDFSLVRIVSRNDLLFKQDELLSLIDICKEKFASKQERKIVIDVDNCIMFGSNFSQELNYDVIALE